MTCSEFIARAAGEIFDNNKCLLILPIIVNTSLCCFVECGNSKHGRLCIGLAPAGITFPCLKNFGFQPSVLSYNFPTPSSIGKLTAA